MDVTPDCRPAPIDALDFPGLKFVAARSITYLVHSPTEDGRGHAVRYHDVVSSGDGLYQAFRAARQHEERRRA